MAARIAKLFRARIDDVPAPQCVVAATEPPVPAPRPALDHFRSLQSQVLELKSQQAQLARREMEFEQVVQGSKPAKEQFSATMRRLGDLLAAGEDTTALEAQVAIARGELDAAIRRADLATEAKASLAEDHKPIAAELLKLSDAVAKALLDARLEALAESMPALIAAEQQYVNALVDSYARVELVEEIGGVNSRPRPFLLGAMRAADLLLPRPFHPDFNNEWRPIRGEIHERVMQEALRLSREI